MKRSRRKRKRSQKKVEAARSHFPQTPPINVFASEPEQKGASHYKPEFYQRILRHFSIYKKLDLTLKVTISSALLVFLLLFASLKTSLISLGVLVGLKTLFQLVLMALKNSWMGGMPGSTTYRLKKLPPNEIPLGQYDMTTVYDWIRDCCEKMSMSVPKKLIIHDSKQANAAAWQQRFLFFMKDNEIHILSSLFEMLNPEELQAVICHELAHIKSHFPIITPSIQLVPLLTSRLTSYRWCIEYLADYAAVEHVGMTPTVNGLIKIHQRGYLIQEIWTGLLEVYRDYPLDVEDMKELNTILEHALPHDLKSEEEIPVAIEQIINQYFTERTGKAKKVGGKYKRQYKRTRVALRRSKLAKQYRTVDWTTFDNKIRDNYLEDEELEDLYLYLKGNKNVRLFFGDLLKDEEAEKLLTHPPLHKRIIFAVEAVERDWTSTSNPTGSDESSYQYWWSRLDPEWQRILREAAKITGDQPTEKEFEAISRLHTLDCSSTAITDLAPLRRLTHLRTFDCSHTRIRSLQPLQHLSNLQTLRCSDTNIIHLEPLRHLRKLEQLWCNDTQVRHLKPLQYLTHLKELHFDRTFVDSVAPLKDLPLKKLSCRNTPALEDFDLLLDSVTE